jgi:hypothetical protein
VFGWNALHLGAAHDARSAPKARFKRAHCAVGAIFVKEAKRYRQDNDC